MNSSELPKSSHCPNLASNPFQNVICNGGQFEVVGSLLSQQVFMLGVYDRTAKQHIIYSISPQILALYLTTGTIALNGTHVTSMSDMLNYDPAKSGKKSRIISNMAARDAIERPELLGLSKPKPEDIKGRLILLYYNPEESQVSDDNDLS